MPVLDARPAHLAADLHLVTWGAPAGQVWPVADVAAVAAAVGAAALVARSTASVNAALVRIGRMIIERETARAAALAAAGH